MRNLALDKMSLLDVFKKTAEIFNEVVYSKLSVIKSVINCFPFHMEFLLGLKSGELGATRRVSMDMARRCCSLVLCALLGSTGVVVILLTLVCRLIFILMSLIFRSANWTAQKPNQKFKQLKM